MTKTDTQAMHAALLGPDLDEAHDQLAQLLDDPDAGNDDIRDAAIDIGVRSGNFFSRRNLGEVDTIRIISISERLPERLRCAGAAPG